MAEDNEGAPDSLMVIRPPVAPSTATYSVLGGEVAAAAAYRRRATSANTIRAYESDWRRHCCTRPFPQCCQLLKSNPSQGCMTPTFETVPATFA